MMNALLTTPIYDVLELSQALGDINGSARAGEINLLGYLACLVSCASGEDPSYWGYAFAATEEGSPFASMIEMALDLLVRRGLLTADRRTLNLTTSGIELLDLLRKRTWTSDRLLYLHIAANSLLALPIGTIRLGLECEPGLFRARAEGNRRLLLQDAELSELRLDIHEIRELLPALRLEGATLLWLRYMLEGTKEELR